MARLRSPLAPFFALALLAALYPAAAGAQQSPGQSAVVQQILDGKELYIDQQQARVKQRAQAPQLVSTGGSRGQLSFDSGAVGRLNRQSQLRLGSSCFVLDRGQLLVSGKQGGCTRSARLSVRGTNYLLEVDDNGESQLSVLEGEVAVEPLKDGEPTGQPPTTVQAGQRLRLSPEGVVLTLLALTKGDYTQILQGPLFEGFRMPLANAAALESYVRSRLPGVPLPALPSTPTLPSIGLPRFF